MFLLHSQNGSLWRFFYRVKNRMQFIQRTLEGAVVQTSAPGAEASRDRPDWASQTPSVVHNGHVLSSVPVFIYLFFIPQIAVATDRFSRRRRKYRHRRPSLLARCVRAPHGESHVMSTVYSIAVFLCSRKHCQSM